MSKGKRMNELVILLLLSGKIQTKIMTVMISYSERLSADLIVASS